MTFDEWLETYNPDWRSEYSGDILGLADAWNAALMQAKQVAMDNHEDEEYGHAAFRCYNIALGIENLTKPTPSLDLDDRVSAWNDMRD